MISWGIGALLTGVLSAAHLQHGRRLGRADLFIYIALGSTIGLLGWWSLAVFVLLVLWAAFQINRLDPTGEETE
jgi:hypothetical protein